MFIYAEFEIINMFFKERRSKYKPAIALNTQHFLNCSCLFRDFSLVMEIWFKVMEKSWKSPGNPLVKMCKNPPSSIAIARLQLQRLQFNQTSPI